MAGFGDYLKHIVMLNVTCVCVHLQNDVVCLGKAPESFVVEIHTESVLVHVFNSGQCLLDNNSNMTCGMFTSQSEDGHLTLVLNLSEYLQLNHMYLGQIEMHNSAGIASTSIEISESQLHLALYLITDSNYLVYWFVSCTT